MDELMCYLNIDQRDEERGDPKELYHFQFQEFEGSQEVKGDNKYNVGKPYHHPLPLCN